MNTSKTTKSLQLLLFLTAPEVNKRIIFYSQCFSSEWSSQSTSPSHFQEMWMHIWSRVLHWNSDFRHLASAAVQLLSSLLSLQSSSPSQTQVSWMQFPLAHLNSNSLHDTAANRRKNVWENFAFIPLKTK